MDNLIVISKKFSLICYRHLEEADREAKVIIFWFPDDNRSGARYRSYRYRYRYRLLCYFSSLRNVFGQILLRYTFLMKLFEIHIFFSITLTFKHLCQKFTFLVTFRFIRVIHCEYCQKSIFFWPQSVRDKHIRRILKINYGPIFGTETVLFGTKT